MREIKFRAWNSIDKCFCDNSTTLTNLRGFIKSKHYHPMQYTGLKDKNGVEIYEGDIVMQRSGFDGECLNKRIGEVIFDGCQFKVKSFELDLVSFGSFLYYYEVIGNIYENPELLEQSK